jgi:hypothetical protein
MINVMEHVLYFLLVLLMDILFIYLFRVNWQSVAVAIILGHMAGLFMNDKLKLYGNVRGICWGIIPIFAINNWEKPRNVSWYNEWKEKNLLIFGFVF